jgi:hypothetical protein
MICPMLTSWKLWLAVHRARREIERIARLRCPTARVLSRQGTTPRHLSFRIATKTDKDRDRLRAEPNLHQQFCNALVHSAYPADAVTRVRFRIESQETVDRDYGKLAGRKRNAVTPVLF